MKSGIAKARKVFSSDNSPNPLNESAAAWRIQRLTQQLFVMNRLQKYCIIPVASASSLKQDGGTPVNDTSENADGVFNLPGPTGCGVLNLNGVFYARVSLNRDENPILVALHGICSEIEAQQALRTIVRLHRNVCPTVTAGA